MFNIQIWQIQAIYESYNLPDPSLIVSQYNEVVEVDKRYIVQHADRKVTVWNVLLPISS